MKASPKLTSDCMSLFFSPQDPVMRQVLDDMQANPASAHKHMQDARVKANIETLMAAGIIQTG